MMEIGVRLIFSRFSIDRRRLDFRLIFDRFSIHGWLMHDSWMVDASMKFFVHPAGGLRPPDPPPGGLRPPGPPEVWPS